MPGHPGTEHDGHLARRRLHRIELHDRLAGGFLGEVLGRLLVEKEVERYAAAAAGITALRRTARPARASTATPMRAIGWRSKLSTPSLVATSTCRRLSA